MSSQTSDIEVFHPDGRRSVPIRIYRPQGPPRAWIIFSVGFGGNRAGYAYLGRGWADKGIAAVITEHVGSNLEVLRSFSQKRREERNAEVVRRVQDPSELEARPKDLNAVWDALREEFQGLPLGLGGHSYGSYSVLAGSGMEPQAIRHGVKSLPAQALLIMSPQPPNMLFLNSEYQKIQTPTLLMTGTQDGLLTGGADYEKRLQVYDALPSQRRNFVVLQGVEHMGFAGIGLNLNSQLQSIETLTSLWWEQHLFGSTGGRNWSQLVASLHLPTGLKAYR